MPRTKTTLKLTDTDTRDAALERLATYLPLEIDGYVCTTETVLNVLIQAAVTRRTIESVCNDLDEMVDGETVRGYLNEQIQVDGLQELEPRVNQALVAGLPRRLWKPRLHIAIDLHDEPFYGHTPELVGFTCGGLARKGTTRFFRMATVYVIFKDMRVALALLFVHPEDALPELVAALLRRLRILGLKIKRLYFDKGFCTTPVLRYVEKVAGLPSWRVPFAARKAAPGDYAMVGLAIRPPIPSRVNNTGSTPLPLRWSAPILLTSGANARDDGPDGWSLWS